MNYEPSTQAALSLASELGGRLLFDQINRAVALSLDDLSNGDNPLTEDQLVATRRIMVSHLMSHCFNPAYAEGESINRLTMNREIKQVGYNSTEALCYLPIQKILGFYQK